MAEQPSRALSASDEAALRDLLTAERAAAVTRVGVLTLAWDDIVASSSLVAVDDEHDPEGATIAFERAHVQALLDQARSQLADLDLALERLGRGRYGTCERCGQPIALERLRARPAATTCVHCTRPRR
ncbi:TraR/DksA family transcriptional regulator [Microbispora sp. ATCC PTA-5024]|uniref:TraR/DksA family transcriptional regulator n=1 Tax=Microbispora sp. ATCC PTA-5024 TaxID=316330 RepID=UPI0003DB809D|nr:TraR/DksA C4-type zinc finger protein [Microbispora sp. ATCC PTA-5024]ETK36632.1 suppressor protein DnaK [Microbispora sp. ATCC PTA-5024]